jgi:MATE family multidrug resistance protein
MAPAAGAVVSSRRKNWSDECKNLWRVAGPVILTGILQFLLGFVTTAFVGHIGKVELAAVSIVNGVVEGLAFGLLVINNHDQLQYRRLKSYGVAYRRLSD